MEPQWKRALPGALVLTLIAGACQDAPFSPRAPTTRGSELHAVAHVTAFSGRSSDSLVDFVTSAWARLGHPEYRRALNEWRQRELGTIHTGRFLAAPDRRATAPSALLIDGTDGGDTQTLKDPPKIMAHTEALYFGHVGGGINIPDILQGELKFVGDQGWIGVGTLSITSTSGAVYPVSGVLASGSGQLIGCADLTLGDCANTKRLAGSLRIDGSPVCGASANGNLYYSAQNVQTTYGTTSISGSSVNGGNIQQAANLSAGISAVAAPCDSNPTDSTTDNPSYPTGNPVDPYPVPGPWPDPGPIPYEPPPGPPPNDQCYAYFNYLLLAIVVVCDAT